MKRRLLISAMRVIAVAGAMAVSISDSAASLGDPQPVLTGKFGDPAVAWTGTEFIGVATGDNIRMAIAPDADGPWARLGAALTSVPDWAVDGGMWAPEIQHVKDDKWVIYYAAKAKGMQDNQRCIGVAISNTGPRGPYDPIHWKPLVCPPEADNPGKVSIDPPGHTGFIDPSTFTTADGRNVLLFKSQRKELGTRIYSVELDADWTSPTSAATLLTKRDKGQIENPHMVMHDGDYYLLASYDDWNSCEYKTVWMKSSNPRTGFPSADSAAAETQTTGVLLRSKPGFCGPGGLSVVWQDGTRHAFFHAYKDGPTSDRELYAGKLIFSDGKPKIADIYDPIR